MQRRTFIKSSALAGASLLIDAPWSGVLAQDDGAGEAVLVGALGLVEEHDGHVVA